MAVLVAFAFLPFRGGIFFYVGLLKLTFNNEDNAKTGDVFIPWLARACCKSP